MTGNHSEIEKREKAWYADAILSEIFNLAKKNNLLRWTRDLLLAKLISGEVEVSAVDIETGEKTA